MFLFNFFRGKGDELYPFEVRIIEAIESRLDGTGSAKLKSQVSCINKVQRLTDGKEVNLYRMVRGKPAFEESLRFPHAGEEALLATVRLKPLKQGTQPLKVEAWIANGRLFSLVFDRPPSAFFGSSKLETVQIDIGDVTVWIDPMQDLGENVLDQPGVLPKSLQDFFGKNQALVSAPLGESRRAALIAQIDAQLPPDYLELTNQIGDAAAGQRYIHGLTAIRKVTLTTESYYILAETEGAGIAVKEGDRSGAVYKLSYELEEPRSIGRSFEAALAELPRGA